MASKVERWDWNPDLKDVTLRCLQEQYPKGPFEITEVFPVPEGMCIAVQCKEEGDCLEKDCKFWNSNIRELVGSSYWVSLCTPHESLLDCYQRQARFSPKLLVLAI